MRTDAQPSLEPGLLASIRSRWPLILASVTLFVITGTLLASTREASYGATSAILVADDRPTEIVGKRDSRDAARYVADQVAVLRSLPVAERAVELSSAKGSPLGLTAKQLQNRTHVTYSADSNYVTIRVSAPTPAAARSAANNVVKAYRAVVRASTSTAVTSALEQVERAIAALGPGVANNALRQRLNTRRDQLRLARNSTGDGVELFAPAALGTDEGAPFRSIVMLALALGCLVGVGLAYLLGMRRVTVDERSGPATILEAPALIEVPTFTPAEGALPILEAPDGNAAEAFRFLALALDAPLGGLSAAASAAWSEALPAFSDEELEVLHVVSMGIPLEKISDHVDTTVDEATQLVRRAAGQLVESGRRGPGPHMRLGTDGEGRTVSFVAATPRSGTSTIVANTALAAADEGMNVLVVDGDLAGRPVGRPTALASLLGTLPAPANGGASSRWPRSGRSRRDRPSISQADTRSARGTVSLCTIQVGEDRTQGRADQLRDAFASIAHGEYDLVLVDVPPLLHAASAGVLLLDSPSTVVVVRRGETARHIAEMRDRLDLLGVRSLGYVFNTGPAVPRARALVARSRFWARSTSGAEETVAQPLPTSVTSTPSRRRASMQRTD